MTKKRKYPFYTLFLVHIMLVLFSTYYLSSVYEGLGLWLCAGIGFFFGLSHFYSGQKVIRSIIIALAPMLTFFLVSYFIYSDINGHSQDYRESTTIFSRTIENLSNLNKLSFTNYKVRFYEQLKYSKLAAIICSFIVAKLLVSFTLKQKRERNQIKEETGSLLEKRYKTKSTRFQRRF